MKKCIWIFIKGFITGIIALFVTAMCISKWGNRMTFFDEPGECLSTNSLKVFQVTDKGAALAREIYDLNPSHLVIGPRYGQAVLLINKEGKFYYDEQIINIPENKCIRQVGIYKYPTESGIKRTVPIVEIME